MIIYSPTFTGSVQITGSQLVTGDLTVQGNLTAQTFILSSSVSYFTESFASGSTRFGDSMDDTMKVTGSLLLTGSMFINTVTAQNAASNRGNLTINGATSILNLATGDTNSGYLYHSGTDMLLVNAKNGVMQFYTNDTERMRITSTGIVQIGADGIGGGGANNLKFNYEVNAGSRSWLLTNDVAAFGDFAIQQSTTRTGTSYTSILNLGSNGAATFSSSVTATQAFINGAAGYNYIAFNSSTNIGYVGDANWIFGGSTSDFGIRSTNNLVFGIGASEKMRITSAGTISIASGGNVEIDNGYLSTSAGTGTSYCTKLYTAYNYPYVDTYLDSVAGTSYEGRIIFRTNTGGGAFGNRMIIYNSGAVAIQGALSKGSGTFKIDHPLESKKDTNYLVHSFVEGPRADLIYRGKITLVNGAATLNIDETVGMTEGTFAALNRDVQCFTTNETGWDAVKGKVEGNILTITSQNTESTDEISWMVIGERQDEHIKNTEWTDENGRPILEPLKP
jgi:hypothetical protein